MSLRMRMTPGRTAVMCGILTALGPFSMAVYTPAMPALTEVFGTTEATIKATLAAYFAGFAGAQLICGPLSDAFGRRPVILAFLTFYFLASLAALMAPDVHWLIGARVAQGVGASACMVIARAIVRDLFEGAEAVRIMNLVGMMLGVGPAVAPMMGGVTLDLVGWEAIFLLMVLYGVALAAAMAALVPETLPRERRRRLRLGDVARSYVALAGDARFMRPTMVIAGTLGAIYTMGTILPFVMIDTVGLSPTAFGLSMIAQSGSFILGSATMAVVLRHFDARRLLPLGFALVLTGGASMCVNLVALPPSALGVIVSLAIFSFGLPFLLAQLMTEALRPFPHLAGSAASMMGFLQMSGGLAGAAAAMQVEDPALALGSIPLTMGLIGLLSYTLLGRKAAARACREAERAPAE
jgi:MFS transporter, DHA1 family, multidrug resistance protein